MQKRYYSLTSMLFIVFSILIACSEDDAVSPIIPSSPTLPNPAPIPTPPTPTPPVGYKAPVAKAGNDTTVYVPFHNIVLNGRESIGNNIASYKWTVIKGPHQVGITYYDKPKAFVSGLKKVGVYEFLLTVTDIYNLSSSDTVRVTVAEPNCNSQNKEYIFKDLKWSFAWIMEIDIYDVFSYLPPDSHIKGLYIKRDGSEQWEPIIPLDYNSSDYGLYHEWEYGNGWLVIFPGRNGLNDTPDIKIEYCN